MMEGKIKMCSLWTAAAQRGEGQEVFLSDGGEEKGRQSLLEMTQPSWKRQILRLDNEARLFCEVKLKKPDEWGWNNLYTLVVFFVCWQRGLWEDAPSVALEVKHCLTPLKSVPLRWWSGRRSCRRCVWQLFAAMTVYFCAHVHLHTHTHIMSRWRRPVSSCRVHLSCWSTAFREPVCKFSFWSLKLLELWTKYDLIMSQWVIFRFF